MSKLLVFDRKFELFLSSNFQIRVRRKPKNFIEMSPIRLTLMRLSHEPVTIAGAKSLYDGKRRRLVMGRVWPHRMASRLPCCLEKRRESKLNKNSDIFENINVNI